MAGQTEGDLRARLAAEGWPAEPWSNGPGFRYAAHRHGYDKVLVVAAGSITFRLPGRGAAIELAVGDRLDLPAQTDHDALVGSTGVVCLEAHAPAGTLPTEPRARGTDW